MSLRLAQELSYLYGAQDLWRDGQVDDEKVKKQLLLYCGVMFGVSGAVSGVRVLSTQIAKTTLKKLPQKALTKTFWYPIVKQIGKAIGVKVTKTTVAQGFSKAIPVIGGVISGSINFASMMPMANRLQKTLDSAAFGYTEEDLEKDIIEIENITADNPAEEKDIKSKFVDSGKKAILEIYTKDKPTKKQSKLLNDGINSFIKGPVSQEELRKIYHESDIALHVESSDLKNRLATRFSFSTKIIDCIFSGCAVLAFCWNQHSGLTYLKREDAALCVSSKEELYAVLSKICENPQIICDYSYKAYVCGKQNHDKKQVQKMLLDDFSK